MNGSGIAKVFGKEFGCDLRERVMPGRIGLKVFVGCTGPGVKVIGWNKNLQSSFGVSNEYIDAVAVVIAHQEVGSEL